MAYKTTRMNFFDRQFLRAQDFKDEQSYHIDRRRMHNQTLHTSGIVNGLNVSPTYNRANQVDVSPGVAITPQGQEIAYNTGEMLQMPTGYDWVDIWICYKDVPSSPSTDPGITGFTRIEESPELKIDPRDRVEKKQAVRLARVNLDRNNGNRKPDATHPEGIDTTTTYRQKAGTALTDTLFSTITLKNTSTLSSDYPTLSSSNPNEVLLAGTLNATQGFIGDGSQITNLSSAEIKANTVEKLNGEFRLGKETIEKINESGGGSSSRILITSRNLTGKLILVRGWATTLPSLSPFWASGGKIFSSNNQFWIINNSATTATLKVFTITEYNILLNVNLEISSVGINMILTAELLPSSTTPTNKDVSYSFQLSWQE